MKNTLDTVLNYHRRSKHHLQRYAAGPGGLDWKNQPDPFRHFTGCARWEMPLLEKSHRPRYADLYQPGKIAPLALTRNNIAALLELAFGLSAWKQYGEQRWALRNNPSSGNLHPTEAYVVMENTRGIEDGVHHYVTRHFQERFGVAKDLYQEAIEHNISYVRKIMDDHHSNFRSKLKRVSH